jgi:parallel beta-helix repeat protein
MNQNNKRSRDDETNNTSNANKKAKGEDENERKDQEIERQRQEIEHQRQIIELQRQRNERQRQKIEMLQHPIRCNKIGYCAKCTQVNCMNGRHSDSLPCAHCGEDFSRGKSTKQSTIDFLRNFPGEKPKVLDRNEANQWIKDVPEELWLGEIMPYFSMKELSLGGTIAKHFQKYWVTFKSKRKLSVPKDFSSLREAVRVGQILSRRGIIRSTNENLLKIMLSNGVHDEDGERVNINFPVSIIGESREHCVVIGGFLMNGTEGNEIDVNVSSLTLRKSKQTGVWADNGASMHLDNVSVVNSGDCGVYVKGTTSNTMKNCNISHSKYSGLYVERGLMTVDGNATSIQHNGTNGSSSFAGGLHTYTSSCSIHLVSPLTIETISTNNGNGGNHGGLGTIKSVDKDGKVLEVVS